VEVRRSSGSWERPAPRPEAWERPFFEAAARGELWYQRCPACDRAQFYPRPACTACGAECEWALASGRGQVHTFTVVRQSSARGFKGDVPYVVAMIDLEEGVRMMGNVLDCETDDVAVGTPVEAVAIEFEEGLALPQWRIRAGG